jgi:2-methylfumaryl-CoA isomerase
VDYHRWPLHKGRSLYWTGLNAGKRSVCIDTRTSRGRDQVVDLIASAGTCVTNLPLGDWMSYEALRARRDDLVLLTFIGNPDGTPAVDYTVNAAVGFPHITGSESSDAPVNHVLPAWDVIAAQLGVSAILAAELRRSRTHRGSHVQLSLMDVALSTVSRLGILAEAQLESEPRARYGNYLYGSFGRDFRTADGRDLMVVALTPRQWRGLVAATESATRVAELELARGADFRKEGDRFTCRGELAAIFERWIGRHSLGEVRDAFDRNGVLWGPYQTAQELMHEDARASQTNPLMTVIHQPSVGEIRTARSPLGEVDALIAPELGAHTRAVLEGWLGMDEATLDGLETSAVIGTS